MDLDKDFNLTVGLRIREIREVLGLTREQFSEQCNLSTSFLAAVESGKKSVTSKTLYKICSTFDISADYIIRGNHDSFENDMILEMLHSMDKKTQEHALIILREFIKATNELKQ